MKKDETVKEMYNRMKRITNQIKSLGGDKWGDREIVDKLLTIYMARDVILPSLIRAERGFKHFTAENVLGRIEAHHDQLKRVKINQDLADLQEQAAKNNGLALQAKLKARKRLPNLQRMMTPVMVKMMSLMMSKWHFSSRTLEEF
jgi:hypothetical protein